MFKEVRKKVWAFDAEWVPDATAGRAVYGLSRSMSDAEVIQEMWVRGGATDEEPRPYLKTMLCRLVSISAVTRETTSTGVRLRLFSLPRVEDGGVDSDEANIVGRFLAGVGEHEPQLVGFNSRNADLRILFQRALALGLRCPGFCHWPDKAWDDWNIDLQGVIGGWGKATPSLHEAATTCGIPGKLEMSGEGVVDHWLTGDLDRIVAYNECDALTTYLLWLRTAHLGGFVSSDGYDDEQTQLRELLEHRIAERPGNEHRGQDFQARLARYWLRLSDFSHWMRVEAWLIVSLRTSRCPD